MPQTPEFAELWTLAQRRHAVRCVAAQHPLGIELRYVMNEHPLFSRVLGDWRSAERQAREWYDQLVARGWSTERANLPLQGA